NSFTLRASPGASGVAVFNHNWDGGWRSDGGRLRKDEHERLTLMLEPGRQEYVLRYRPPYFIPSLVLWALGLLVLASLWVLPAGGPRRGAGARGGRQAPADYGEGVGDEQGPQSTEQVEQSSPRPVSHV
ncbi:MAG TPA: hypothetical protein VLQ93_07590, partial [Myxococcaceae bacterium]|nr:hypothetical protein [Myxococcaceae bacterium]